MFFYFDKYYLILVIPAMIFAIYAQAKVKSTFSKFSNVYSQRGYTAAQVSEMILRSYGVYGVSVQRVSGHLTDHYDPRSNVIRLSDSVYSSTSVAAIGVAAHETGHAIQYAQSYFPIKIRAAIIPIATIGSQLGIPLAVIGYFMSYDLLINIGLLLFLVVTLFQFVTLPVEFNASRRALKILENDGLLYENEMQGARRVLTAAAMTYVAAFLSSLANLLRLILLFGGRRGDD